MKILSSKLLYKHSKNIYTAVKAFACRVLCGHNLVLRALGTRSIVRRHFVAYFFFFSVRFLGLKLWLVLYG